MKDESPSKTIVKDVLKIKKGERVLIISNPSMNLIAQDLYEASQEAGAKTVLMYQSAKTSFDNAEEVSK